MAIVLSLSMVLCLVPSFAFADTNATDGTTPPAAGETGTQKTDISGTGGTIDAIGDQEYTGSPITLDGEKLVVKAVSGTESKVLTAGTDYDAAYEKNTDVGTATVTVTGKGSYTGTQTATFRIVKTFTDSDKPSITIPTQNKAQTGDDPAKMENVEVIWNGKTLAENTDYTVTGDNSKAGTSVAVIKFTGNYIGEFSMQYNVVSNNIETAAFYFTNLNAKYTYNGAAQEPGIKLVMDGVTLTADKDYTLKYENNINAGTAKIVVNGINDYAGEIVKEFVIEKANLSDAEVVFTKDSYTATGSEIKPQAGTDFDVYFGGVKLDPKAYTAGEYKNNVAIGTASFTLSIPATAPQPQNFTGTKTVNFQIVEKAVSDLKIVLEKDSYEYTGSQIKPGVKVMDGDKELTIDKDYTIVYGDNIAAGSGVVTITGKGAAYVGSKTVAFKINGKKAGIVTGYNTYTRYWPNPTALNLKARTKADALGFIYSSLTPEVAVVDQDGNVTIVGTGQAKITVATYGTKEYNPITKTVTINVKPRKPVIKVTSPVKKQIKVTITKVQGATKYQVKYGRNGVYYSKYITHKDNEYKKVYTTIKNRVSGKSYEVKVRAYKTMADGTKVWGNWTAVKTVKAK